MADVEVLLFGRDSIKGPVDESDAPLHLVEDGAGLHAQVLGGRRRIDGGDRGRGAVRGGGGLSGRLLLANQGAEGVAPPDLVEERVVRILALQPCERDHAHLVPDVLEPDRVRLRPARVRSVGERERYRRPLPPPSPLPVSYQPFHPSESSAGTHFASNFQSPAFSSSSS